MENTFWMALGASSLAALVTAIGIYTIRHFEAWGRKYSIYFICFAAGVLISHWTPQVRQGTGLQPHGGTAQTNLWIAYHGRHNTKCAT